jgi:hypothetical protein
VNCETFQDELVAHLRGELPPARAEAMEAHLEACPACRAERESVRDLFRVFRKETTVDPSPAFRETVLRSVRRETAVRPSSSRVARPRNLALAYVKERVRQAPILMTAIAVHAAALVLLAGVYLPVRLTQTKPILVEPGLPELPPMGQKQIDEITETAIPKDFGELHNPLGKLGPEPSDPPFPWPSDDEVDADPKSGGRVPPKPTVDPKDFGEKLIAGPARAEVLAWFGARLDETKKADARKALAMESTGPLIERGLRWLAKNQGEDGGFDPVPFGGQAHFKTAVSGLALLAFLGDGNSPTRGPHAKAVERAVAFLLDGQDSKSGRFGPDKGNYMYNHGIALLALCEAAGMAAADRSSRGQSLAAILPPARKGVAFLLAIQSEGGGWGYTSRDRQSDTSVTAWPVAALSTALRLNVVTPGKAGEVKKALERAARWFRSVTLGSGAVGYRKAGEYKTGPHSLTAISLYCRGLFHEAVAPPGEEILEKQRALVASRAPSAGESPDFYFWYYAAFGLVHTGDDGPPPFLATMADVLGGLQEADGGFPRRSQYGSRGGRIYTTAMALLALEVPYRYPVR